jgi:tripartite ATP-independent transporter DctM subunit
MLVWIFLIALMTLIFVGMPVGFSMGTTALIVLVIDRGIANIPFGMIAQRMVYGVNSFPLLAIPFFLIAGRLANVTGLTERIFRFCNALIGHVRGGLGHVNILAAMIFAGMTGSAVSEAVGLGTIEIKAMTDEGYDVDFSAAVTAAASTIGPIIPPSIPMVLYGVLGSVSVTSLFIGGIVPGIMMGLFLMITVFFIVRKRNYPVRKRATFRQILSATGQAFFALISPVILIGGIWTGIFTPTEAAAVAVVYTLFLGTFVYRTVRRSDVVKVLRESLDDSSVLLFIVAAASIYGWLLARYQIPPKIAENFIAVTKNPYIFLLIINVFLIIVGCFMESLAAINILTPILLPLAISLGIDPLHFGLVMILNLMIGLLTPPVGMCLYAVQRVANIPFEKLTKALMIYIVALLVVLLLITFFPPLVTWLPSTISGRKM